MRSLLPLLLVVSLAACGDDADDHDHDHDQPDADVTAPDAAPADAELPSSVETESFSLAAGVFAEGTFTAGAGDRVLVEMTAAGEVIAWDLHGHVGGDTQVVESGEDQMSVTYEFAPTDDGDWFVLVGNSGTGTQTIDVTLSFYGDAAFGAWK